MSTRASILVRDSIADDAKRMWLYHHCDGYPMGVGSELADLLKEYKYEDWKAEGVVDFITGRDMSYRNIDSYTWDSDYIYIIDCLDKRLMCFKHDFHEEFDDQEGGDPLEIPGNIFNGERPPVQMLDFGAAFSACPSLPLSALPEVPVPVTADKRAEYRARLFTSVLAKLLEKWELSDLTNNIESETDYILDIANSITNKALKRIVK